MSKIKTIAICGTRGVPASYGGFETFAEELGSALVKKGYRVLVYCRYYNDSLENSKNFKHKGMECISIKAPKHKYFETPIHTLKSFLHPSIREADLILLCNAANSPFGFIPKLLRKPLLINVDGIERERRKWNWIGKSWYLMGEFFSAIYGNELISDADYIQEYYKKRYFRKSTVIRYGAKHLPTEYYNQKINSDFSNIYLKYKSYYDNYDIKCGNYLLYVSRLEPENNADKVILAYNLVPESIRLKYPLVIVGDAPYAEDFKKRIKEIACQEVKFLGYRFGEEYLALQSGAYFYIQATEVGGTHPALVEATGFANAIIANSVKEHFEVVDGCSIFYKYNDINDLSTKMQLLLTSEDQVINLRKLAYQRSLNEYSWDAICHKYEKLFNSVIP
jgi:glycosyltransferase involved in cell wall biosynthesis